MKKHRPYILEKYNPDWKQRFESVAEKLYPIFAENLVEIEHIGSTSIRGMLAKPQVDVLVVVKNLDAIKNLCNTFTQNGFTIYGRGYVAEDDYYISLDDSNGVRLVSVHVLEEGNPKIEEYKIFREYLNQNDEDRNLYIQTKRDLYSLHKENYADYDSGKKNVITAIKSRAKKWAENK